MPSIEAQIQEKLTEALKLIEQLSKTRETSLAITKIDEAVLWLTAHITKMGLK